MSLSVVPSKHHTNPRHHRHTHGITDTHMGLSATPPFFFLGEHWLSTCCPLQIETEGDAVTACAFSSSGEMMAFGGSGGYVHLWATSATPRVNMVSQPLDFPTPTAKPPRLTEQDSFAQPFPYGASQVCLSVLPYVTGACLLPMILLLQYMPDLNGLFLVSQSLTQMELMRHCQALP